MYPAPHPWWARVERVVLLAVLAVMVGLLGPASRPSLADPERTPLADPVPLPLTAPPPPQPTGPVVLIAPTRVLDTRPAPFGPIGFDGTTGNQITAGPLLANTVRRFLINGKQFPQGTGTFTFPTTYGIIANVTLCAGGPSCPGPGSGGFVTVFPGNVADIDRPNASTVNPSTPIAHDVAAVAIAPTGAPPNVGTIAIFTTLNIDVIIDVYGYFTEPDTFWSLSGNAGTIPGLDFLGTTDASSLVFKTSNTEAMRLTPSGLLGVGTNSPIAQLEANGITSGNIALLGTASSRAVLGRLGVISCAGTYAVGGCAGATGGAGVFGDSDSGIGAWGRSGSRGVVGTLGSASCPGAYGVGGCAGSAVADGVYGVSNANGAGVRAANTGGGSSGLNIFIAEAPVGTVRARIDGTGHGFFSGGVSSAGGDYADLMPAADSAEALEPGDVLVIDPELGEAVRRSFEPSSPLLAGVYSTKPSVLGMGERDVNEMLVGDVPVALLGIVPTKVSAENGPIRPGDLLTTAATPGHAMKATLPAPQGTLLGKALAPLAEGTGVIRVLVTLR